MINKVLLILTYWSTVKDIVDKYEVEQKNRRNNCGGES
jgi:hypothetical protein